MMNISLDLSILLQKSPVDIDNFELDASAPVEISIVSEPCGFSLKGNMFVKDKFIQ